MIPDTLQEPMQGVRVWQNRNGFTVVRLHYTADPAKRTREWLASAARSMPGCLVDEDGTVRHFSPAWQREQEIDFEAMAGEPALLFKPVAPWVIPPLDPPYYANLYRSIDWGAGRSPVACGWYYADDVGHIIKYREYYERGPDIDEHAGCIVDLSDKEEYIFTLLDTTHFTPSSGARFSIAELFDQCGVTCVEAQRPRDATKVVLLNRALALRAWPDGSEAPILQVCSNCVNTIWEWERIRWAEYRGMSAIEHDPKEKIVQKDNHTFDEAGYFLAEMPEMTEPPPEPETTEAAHESLRQRQDRRIEVIADSQLGTEW